MAAPSYETNIEFQTGTTEILPGDEKLFTADLFANVITLDQNIADLLHSGEEVQSTIPEHFSQVQSEILSELTPFYHFLRAVDRRMEGLQATEASIHTVVSELRGLTARTATLRQEMRMVHARARIYQAELDDLNGQVRPARIKAKAKHEPVAAAENFQNQITVGSIDTSTILTVMTDFEARPQRLREDTEATHDFNQVAVRKAELEDEIELLRDEYNLKLSDASGVKRSHTKKEAELRQLVARYEEIAAELRAMSAAKFVNKWNLSDRSDVMPLDQVEALGHLIGKHTGFDDSDGRHAHPTRTRPQPGPRSAPEPFTLNLSTFGQPTRKIGEITKITY